MSIEEAFGQLKPSRKTASRESVEAPAREYRTRLHFFRHGKKAGGNDVSQAEDLVMPLTEEGEQESRAVGKRLNRLSNSSRVAVGSPRARTRHTAYIEMLAGAHSESDDPGLVSEIMSRKGIGQGPWSDRRLDMAFDKDTEPHFDELMDAHDKKKFMHKLYELHVNAAPEDRSESTYAKEARNVAELIDRHAGINKKLLERQEYNEDAAQPVEAPEALERFFGTHGSVGESFLAEVIRQKQGEEAVKDFFNRYPNGFTYNQGFDVDIVSQEGGSTMIKIQMEDVDYKLDIDIDPEELKALIADLNS